MSQTLVDADCWTRTEPLAPKRRPRNQQHSHRRPIPDRAVLTERGSAPAARGASTGAVATCGRLEAAPSRLADGMAPTRADRSGSRGRRQRIARCTGENTEPNPRDRRKARFTHLIRTETTRFRLSLASHRRTGTTCHSCRRLWTVRNAVATRRSPVTCFMFAS
jgi:hypothetical protein